MDRQEVIAFKLTKKEKELIKKKAQEKGLTMSTYIRFQLLNKGGK